MQSMLFSSLEAFLQTSAQNVKVLIARIAARAQQWLTLFEIEIERADR
jgi:hypothetical protein